MQLAAMVRQVAHLVAVAIGQQALARLANALVVFLNVGKLIERLLSIEVVLPSQSQHESRLLLDRFDQPGFMSVVRRTVQQPDCQARGPRRDGCQQDRIPQKEPSASLDQPIWSLVLHDGISFGRFADGGPSARTRRKAISYRRLLSRAGALSTRPVGPFAPADFLQG